MIVVDASIWVEMLRGTLPQELADAVEAEGPVAPAHVDFEVGSALVRLERRQLLEAGEARQLIAAFSSHPVQRIRDSHDAVRAVDLLQNAGYADAWYIALAQRLDCLLMTADAGMGAAAQTQDVPVLGVAPEA